MERSAIEDLIKWKDRGGRKPLLLRGARQVGKTWLMREFGRRHFARTAYVSFDNNAPMVAAFEGDFDTARLLTAISADVGWRVTPDTLVVLDEIQECPRALSSLKYFCEEAPEQPIIAAGSLLGVALRSGISFPVGKVSTLDLWPMTFREFLRAVGEGALADMAAVPSDQVAAAFATRYADLLKKYYFVGGMPEAVSAFAERGDFNEVREIQREILRQYAQDFGKHTPAAALPRIRMVWEALPSQLARENKKFMFGSIREGARAKDFELAIEWLVDCGLVHRAHRVTKPGIPLAAYREVSVFKLFMCDVGLLAAMSGLDARSIIDGNAVYTEFKGALAEQYVMQQLISDVGVTPYYYTNPSSRTEIDFIIQHEDEMIPIEVKAERNLRSRNLRAFCDKFSPRTAIRLSTAGYEAQGALTNIPLWSISSLI